MHQKSTQKALIKAQAIAGALFFVFLILHLSNTVLAIFGPETYNSYQRLIRQIYQQPVLELLLVVGPLITHVIAGAWLYRIRRKRPIQKPLPNRLQSWAGFFLLVVVFGHMLATRGVSYWYGPFAEFAGVSFSLWWIPGYFYPYYFLLFVAGFYHGAMGASTLLRRIRPTQSMRSAADTPNRRPIVLISMASLGAFLALLAFGGVLFEIHDPRDNDYARQYSELLGIDLSGPE